MIQPNTVVIDVRSQGRIAGGKIGEHGILILCQAHLLTQLKNLPKDKGLLNSIKKWKPKCPACEVMADLGFEKFKNLKGGIGSWPFETF